jgi:hypothetical protein
LKKFFRETENSRDLFPSEGSSISSFLPPNGECSLTDVKQKNTRKKLNTLLKKKLDHNCYIKKYVSTNLKNFNPFLQDKKSTIHKRK